MGREAHGAGDVREAAGGAFELEESGAESYAIDVTVDGFAGYRAKNAARMKG